MALTVGVAGITGKFAGLVVQNLLKTPSWNIRGLCRSPQKLSEGVRSLLRVSIVQGGAYDLDTLRRFAQGCDVVICCYLGDDTLMTDGQKLLVDACELEHVPRYVASDYSLDFTKLDYGQHPAKDPMKQVKAHLDGKNNVQGVHVLIGVFMEVFWSPFFGVFKADEPKLSFYGNGDETWEATSYATAAEYVAAVAADPCAIGMFHFLGDRKSIRQIASEFAETYEKEVQLERLGSLEDLYSTMQSRFKAAPDDVYAWIAMFYQYYCTNGQTYLKPELDNEKHPDIQPVTFKVFMESHDIGELGDSHQKLDSH